MIKPYFNFHIEVKNFYSYREFIKRRPTKPQHFKFTMLRYQEELSRAEEKQIQLKLLKTLKILKPVYKVDLGECEITDYEFWEPKLLSACKIISHIKTLFVMGPKNGSEFSHFKHFKHFPKLKNVFYKLNSYSSFPDYDTLYKTEEPPDAHYGLKSLKHCPKIRSLGFADFTYDSYFPKVVVEPNHYLRFLESVTLRGVARREERFEFPIDLCQNLRSISLKFLELWSWESLPQILNLLSDLPNLQDIHLSLIKNISPDFLKAFRKITKKGMLQKVKFECSLMTSGAKKLLKALRTCKLTNFSLQVNLEKGLVKAISQFIKGMDNLESLHLLIFSKDSYSKDENFMELCQQISQLQALRNLTLHFQTWARASKETRISNFIPSLSKAFSKPVKIETFHLECEQLDPSEALQSLMSVLKNSTSFLTDLDLNFGSLPCTNKTFRSILKLMQSLVNIQVLKIPCLAVSGPTSHFLNNIVEVVYDLKYLRSFVIGEIKDTVAIFDISHAVETISSKRGLRKFDCRLSHDLQRTLRNDENLLDLDLERVFQKNPYLENWTLVNGFSPFTFDIYAWVED